jgi:hypothetical protein
MKWRLQKPPFSTFSVFRGVEPMPGKRALKLNIKCRRWRLDAMQQACRRLSFDMSKAWVASRLPVGIHMPRHYSWLFPLTARAQPNNRPYFQPPSKLSFNMGLWFKGLPFAPGNRSRVFPFRESTSDRNANPVVHFNMVSSWYHPGQPGRLQDQQALLLLLPISPTASLTRLDFFPFA